MHKIQTGYFYKNEYPFKNDEIVTTNDMYKES